MLLDSQGTKCRRNIAENFSRLSRVHERYRQTDGRAIAYSERKRMVHYIFVPAGGVRNVAVNVSVFGSVCLSLARDYEWLYFHYSKSKPQN